MKYKIRLVPRRIANIDCDRPEVTLWVRSRYGDFARIRFIVDTAADFSAIPLSLAQREGIEFPQSEASRGAIAGLIGTAEKYSGALQVRVSKEDFEWPCDFVITPAKAGASPSIPGSSRATPVLGRAGFLAAFSIGIDGDYLTIERRFAPRSLWRRLVGMLWLKWTREQSVIEPL